MSVHVAVHGVCVCCRWMQCSCLRRDVLSWLLFMVIKYLPTGCFIGTKLRGNRGHYHFHENYGE